MRTLTWASVLYRALSMSAVPGGPDVMLAESVMFEAFMMSQVPR